MVVAHTEHKALHKWDRQPILMVDNRGPGVCPNIAFIQYTMLTFS